MLISTTKGHFCCLINSPQKCNFYLKIPKLIWESYNLCSIKWFLYPFHFFPHHNHIFQKIHTVPLFKKFCWSSLWWLENHWLLSFTLLRQWDWPYSLVLSIEQWGHLEMWAPLRVGCRYSEQQGEGNSGFCFKSNWIKYFENEQMDF